MDAARAPRTHETALRLTPAGRVVLPFALAGTVLSWAAGGSALLLAAAVPGLFGAAVLITWLQIRALEPRSPRTRRAFAGVPLVLHVPVANRSHVVPVLDAVFTHGSKPGVRPAGLLSALRPRASHAVPLGLRFARRGRRRHLKLTVSTSFPFGLVACRRTWRVPCDLLVLPLPGEVPHESLHGTTTAAPRPRRAPDAGEEELFGLREWREGEGLRRVHWLLSARRGRRVVRELHRATEPPVHLVLLACSTPTRRPTRRPNGRDRHEPFEHAVRVAASLLARALDGEGVVWLSIAAPAAAARTVGPLRGRRGLVGALERLAEVESADGDPEAALAAAWRAGPRGARRVLVGVGVSPGRLRGLSLPPGTRVLDVSAPGAAPWTPGVPTPELEAFA